ncbi:MAG: amino acid racemase, partial [Candidatus Aminicenantes bacterium]|nr:amino acid racemase [Candidatus Aminicenantes bacterium]
FLVMPCITAHYYYPEIIKHINIGFIHMIKEVANFIQTELPDIHNFGLLATTGTIKTELFQKEIANTNRHIIIPDPEQQKKVVDAVYRKKGIKAGFKEFPLEILSQIAQHLKKKGAQAIIAGCTEIALVIENLDIDLPTINPLHILASTSIQLAGYSLKQSKI